MQLLRFKKELTFTRFDTHSVIWQLNICLALIFLFIIYKFTLPFFVCLPDVKFGLWLVLVSWNLRKRFWFFPQFFSEIKPEPKGHIYLKSSTTSAITFLEKLNHNLNVMKIDIFVKLNLGGKLFITYNTLHKSNMIWEWQISIFL